MRLIALYEVQATSYYVVNVSFFPSLDFPVTVAGIRLAVPIINPASLLVLVFLRH